MKLEGIEINRQLFAEIHEFIKICVRYNNPNWNKSKQQLQKKNSNTQCTFQLHTTKLYRFFFLHFCHEAKPQSKGQTKQPFKIDLCLLNLSQIISIISQICKIFKFRQAIH